MELTEKYSTMNTPQIKWEEKEMKEENQSEVHT